MKWPRITLVEMVMEWIVPIIGGALTLLLLLRFGFRSFWGFLLVLPGALVFQWGVLFALMGFERIIKRRQKNG